MSSSQSESLPLLTPDILFHTETITARDNSSFQAMELVREGQPLVQLKAPGEIPPPRPFELTTGKHTLLSEDKQMLLAEVDGYPLLSKKSRKDIDLIMVAMIPLVSISEDNMQVDVTLYPPVSGCVELTGKLLSEIVNRAGNYQKHDW